MTEVQQAVALGVSLFALGAAIFFFAAWLSTD